MLREVRVRADEALHACFPAAMPCRLRVVLSGNRVLKLDKHDSHRIHRLERHIHPAAARIVLVEGEPRIIPTFPASLTRKARRKLEQLGVEVRTGVHVTAISADGVMIGSERLAARNVIWTAGVKASPAGVWLGADVDRAGRVKVAPDLSVPGHPTVFVIGDTACVMQQGKPLPGLSPVAMQEGRYVAQVIAARVTGNASPPSEDTNIAPEDFETLLSHSLLQAAGDGTYRLHAIVASYARTRHDERSEDEVQFAFHPTLTRVWSRKGRREQRLVEAPEDNRKGHGFGLVDWRDGWFATRTTLPSALSPLPMISIQTHSRRQTSTRLSP